MTRFVLLATAKQVGHERGDPIGQRVGVQIVMERVVAIRRIETDLDIVGVAARAFEDAVDLAAEVPLTSSTRPVTFLAGSPARYERS